ncbi:Glycerol-3-phosphate acyltransferase [Paraconexibacter sp. AEG42_29]|uniref:Glycerol-3-phosphate acyltransferase n=1 Tax=Paraconexibacter sp. AEG42_29 TaxID=2997339 RepID=A0AAU7B0W7_9ACTN
MTTLSPDPTDTPSGHVPPPLVLSVGAKSTTEQRLIDEWCSRTHPGAEVVPHDSPAVAGRLGDLDGREVVPVRVTWLPPADEEDKAGVGELLSLMQPRRPWGVLQGRVADHSRGRVQVTAGQAATVADLRARFAAETGSRGDAALSAFVARQAVLTCDRAERLLLGDRYKVPRLVAEQIAASARFRERIAALAPITGRTVEDLQADGEACLAELATVQSPLGIDAYRRFMAPMHAHAWTVEVDRAGLEPLRELNKKHALVFLPTHRSYVDPLVLQEALQTNDLPRNHVLGGNNMAWWPLGPIGRRAGVVFIRRNFGTDRVYKLAVREFLGHLVSKRFNLEWYIEGGRTRTGKLRPPKLGLLRYLTEAIDDDRADDVALVPVSIVYDRLREVGAMATEQQGKAKQREGLRWMFDYVRSQRQNVGKARVHFGEPFMLRQALDEAGDPAVRLEKVAFRICDGINAVSPLTPTSLVTFALLGSQGVALTYPQIEELTRPLLDYAARRDLPGPIIEMARPGGLRGGLDSLVDAGIVTCYDAGSEPVWSVDPGKLHIAAFYRNGAVHHFVNRAIIELALLEVLRTRADDSTDITDPAWEAALRLRDLLKFEFFFAEKERFRTQLQAELELIHPDWRERAADGAGATALLSGATLLVAHRTLRAFVDAQLVAATLLYEREPRLAVDPKEFVQQCMEVGHQMVLQGRLHSEAAVSRDSFAAALDLAANRDLVDPGRDEVRVARAAWLAEVKEVLVGLEQVHSADTAALNEVLDDDR